MKNKLGTLRGQRTRLITKASKIMDEFIKIQEKLNLIEIKIQELENENIQKGR